MRFRLPFPSFHSIAAKITVLLLIVAMIGLAGQSILTYLLLSKNIETMLGKRLEHIARTGAMLIPGNQHVKVVEQYLEQDPKLVSRAEFKNIQNTLKRLKEENDLSTDVYTLIHPDWQPDSMIFITMSNEKTYVGNGLPLHPLAEKSLKNGIPMHSALYSDQEGIWISAWAPIKESSGKTVAVIEVDYRASEELAAAKISLLKDLLFPIALAILLCVILGATSGSAFAKPISSLARAAVQVASGDFEAIVSVRGTDEVAFLGKTFNDMTRYLKKSRRALEDYAKNLEVKVEERTFDLQKATDTISAMMNSLSQGFVAFDRDGICLPIFSQACLELLEGSPEKRPIWEVLGLPPDPLKDQVAFLFDEPIPFKDTAGLCPKSYSHSKGKNIELSYYPVYDEQRKVRNVLLVATDRTAEVKALANAAEERAHVETILTIVSLKPQFINFVQEARQLFSKILFSLEGGDPEVEPLLRWMHTLKGGAALFRVHAVEKAAHACEEDFQRGEDPRKMALSVRKVQSEFEHFLKVHHGLLGEGEIVDDIAKPVQSYFLHWDSAAKRIASSLGKRLEGIQFQGGDLRVSSAPYNELFLSLVHALRNAIDHGLERPEERVKAGKKEEGLVSVSFSQEDGLLRIAIEDDGRGIDLSWARKKLNLEKSSDEEVLNRLLSSKITSAPEVTLLSGRAEGLSAVREAALHLAGTVELTTQRGRGTTVIVKVPFLEDSERNSKAA